MKRGVFSGLALVFLLSLAGCSAGWRSDAGSPPAASASTRPSCWTQRDFARDPHQFRFAIVSDNTGGSRAGVFARAVDRLNALRPEFVMCVGDLIPGYTDQPDEVQKMMDEFDQILQPLRMPFFFLPGNHDISNPVQERLYVQRHGRPYYHFVYDNVLFLCLNTEDPPPTHMSDEQVAYVQKVLDQNRDVRWTFVFMHKPMWRQQEAIAEGNWPKIEKMLSARPATIFTGHFHDYQFDHAENHDRFILATTGGGSDLRGVDYGEFDEIVWVAMTDSGPAITNINLDGIYPKDIRTLETAEKVEAMLAKSEVTIAPIFEQADRFQAGVARLVLANGADQPMTARVLFRTCDSVKVSPAGVYQTVAPKTTQTVDIKVEADQPLRIADVPRVQAEWSITYDRAGQSPLLKKGMASVGVSAPLVCRQRRGPVKVDGKLDEWQDLPLACVEPGEISGDRARWKGPDHFSFRFAVEYDDQYVYIAVKTKDDVVFVDPARNPWEQDGLQVLIDGRPDPVRSANGDRKAYVDYLPINIRPGLAADSLPADRIPKGLQMACVKNEDGISAELAIPVAWLNELQGGQWQAIRLNVGAYNRDSAKDPFFAMYWTPKWTARGIPGSGTFVRK